MSFSADNYKSYFCNNKNVEYI